MSCFCYYSSSIVAQLTIDGGGIRQQQQPTQREDNSALLAGIRQLRQAGRRHQQQVRSDATSISDAQQQEQQQLQGLPRAVRQIGDGQSAAKLLTNPFNNNNKKRTFAASAAVSKTNKPKRYKCYLVDDYDDVVEGNKVGQQKQIGQHSYFVNFQRDIRAPKTIMGWQEGKTIIAAAADGHGHGATAAVDVNNNNNIGNNNERRWKQQAAGMAPAARTRPQYMFAEDKQDEEGGENKILVKSSGRTPASSTTTSVPIIEYIDYMDAEHDDKEERSDGAAADVALINDAIQSPTTTTLKATTTTGGMERARAPALDNNLLQPIFRTKFHRRPLPPSSPTATVRSNSNEQEEQLVETVGDNKGQEVGEEEEEEKLAPAADDDTFYNDLYIRTTTTKAGGGANAKQTRKATAPTTSMAPTTMAWRTTEAETPPKGGLEQNMVALTGGKYALRSLAQNANSNNGNGNNNLSMPPHIPSPTLLIKQRRRVEGQQQPKQVLNNNPGDSGGRRIPINRMLSTEIRAPPLPKAIPNHGGHADELNESSDAVGRQIVAERQQRQEHHEFPRLVEMARINNAKVTVPVGGASKEQWQRQFALRQPPPPRDAQGRPLILSPQHCKMIENYAQLYGLRTPTAVQSFVHRNCAFAKIYLPTASCAEIDILVQSCYQPERRAHPQREQQQMRRRK